MPNITSTYPPGQSLTSGTGFGPNPADALVALMREERMAQRRRPVQTSAAAPPPKMAFAALQSRGGEGAGTAGAGAKQPMETVYGKWTTVAGQTFLQEVPPGTPGAHPIGTVPAGARAAAMPGSSQMVGDINAPSRASLAPEFDAGAPTMGASGDSASQYERARLAAALARSNAEIAARGGFR